MFLNLLSQRMRDRVCKTYQLDLKCGTTTTARAAIKHGCLKINTDTATCAVNFDLPF